GLRQGFARRQRELGIVRQVPIPALQRLQCGTGGRAFESRTSSVANRTPENATKDRVHQIVLHRPHRSYFFSFKLAGTGVVTSPVAAHSTPRIIRILKPSLCIASTSCPSTLWHTRPLPYVATHTIASCRPVFFGSLLLSEKAVTSTVASLGMTEF